MAEESCGLRIRCGELVNGCRLGGGEFGGKYELARESGFSLCTNDSPSILANLGSCRFSLRGAVVALGQAIAVDYRLITGGSFTEKI